MQKHVLKTFHFKFCMVFGIGYWKDIYPKEELGIGGVAHNLVFPFIRVQWGYLDLEKQSQ